ncbi:hypothetical protein D3C75_699600 [compost metagenome]
MTCLQGSERILIVIEFQYRYTRNLLFNVLDRSSTLGTQDLGILRYTFKSGNRAAFLHEQRLSGLEIHVGEIDFLLAFLGDCHRSDNHINLTVVQHRNACFGGYFLQLNCIFITQNVLRNGLGNVDIEAFNVAGGRILQSEQSGVIFNTNQQLAAFLDLGDRSRIRRFPGGIAAAGCGIIPGIIVISAPGNYE